MTTNEKVFIACVNLFGLDWYGGKKGVKKAWREENLFQLKELDKHGK